MSCHSCPLERVHEIVEPEHQLVLLAEYLHHREPVSQVWLLRNSVGDEDPVSRSWRLHPVPNYRFQILRLLDRREDAARVYEVHNFLSNCRRQLPVFDLKEEAWRFEWVFLDTGELATPASLRRRFAENTYMIKPPTFDEVWAVQAPYTPCLGGEEN